MQISVDLKRPHLLDWADVTLVTSRRLADHSFYPVDVDDRQNRRSCRMGVSKD